MDKRALYSRLKRLENALTNNLPVVDIKRQDGTITRFYGTPPYEELFNLVNPVVKAYGSSFAELLDVVIHPVPNRYIEELENVRLGMKRPSFFTIKSKINSVTKFSFDQI